MFSRSFSKNYVAGLWSDTLLQGSSLVYNGEKCMILEFPETCQQTPEMEGSYVVLGVNHGGR